MNRLIFTILFSTALLFGQRRGPVFRPTPVRIFNVNPGYVWTYYPGYYNYYPQYVVTSPQACKKETLKDSAGKKHDVLVCRQKDGSFAVIADADKLKGDNK